MEFLAQEVFHASLVLAELEDSRHGRFIPANLSGLLKQAYVMLQHGMSSPSTGAACCQLVFAQ